MTYSDEIILYHGSYTEIDKIDLSFCDESKDFGKGFYLTESKEQAKIFIKTSLIKAKNNGRIPNNQTYGFVTSYKVNFIKDISYYEFDTTNEDWLYYISINRRQKLANDLQNLLSDDFNKYEVIIGKIANDDTNMTLNAFLSGAFGEVGKEQTYAIVTKLLKPDKLSKQFCFKSENAFKMLNKFEVERYEI